MPWDNRLAPKPQNAFVAPQAPLGMSIPQASRPGVAQVDPRLGLGQTAQNVSAGVGQTLVGQLEGLQQLIQNPKATVSQMWGAAKAIGADPMIVVQMLRDARRKAMSGPIGFGEVAGEFLPSPGRAAPGPVSRITEPEEKLADLWHGSRNPPFERFDPAIKGEFARQPALGPGHYIGEKGYAGHFVGPSGSLTKWKPDIKKSLYFDDEGFTPNTPRANAANRQAFEAVKKADPELAYKVFKFNKGRIVAIRLRELKKDPDGKPFLDYSVGERAMNIAGIDSVVEASRTGVSQVMVRDPANLKRVK